MNFVDKPNIIVSDKLKELYKLLQELELSTDESNFYYYRFLVQNCEKDYMYLLLQQLNKMNEIYNLKE
jgi:hypothetical protein